MWKPLGYFPHGVQLRQPSWLDNDGRTPFHFASDRGYVETIQVLLEQGADPIAQTKDGWMAFHFASRHGCVEIIRILIEQGADPTAQTKHVETAFQEKGHVEGLLSTQHPCQPTPPPIILLQILSTQ
jgi:ankyrin repeat protein